MTILPAAPGNSGSGTTLIFPAVNQAAAAYFRAAAQRGESVICASSVRSTAMPHEAGSQLLLPMVYDDRFNDSFFALVRERGISRVYCPVATVHSFLRQLIEQHRLPLLLVGDSPVAEQMLQHRDLMRRAHQAHALVRAIAGNPDGLSLYETASLLKFASAIYGESDDDKLAAIMAIASSAPRGDVVEIGCLAGRSSFVLLYLARKYGLGPLLSVDPWMADACAQSDSPQQLQAVVEAWDYELLSESFFTSVALLGGERHRHLRLPSAEGFAVYAGGRLAETTPPLTGRIGLIHIDGNHDFRFVEEDCRLWLSRLAPGAWLILDDYLWAHGDGPYRVGNELLAREQDRIDRSFVCGKALFVRWKAR